MNVVGSPTVRGDGAAKAQGTAVYGVDVTLPGMLHGLVLRSPVAAGRLTRLDVGAARRMPGVRAVITAADAPEELHGMVIRDQPLFAVREVRFEGEPIAALAADTPEQAAAALAAIDLDIEPMTPVVGLDAALLPGTRLVHREWSTYGVSPVDLPRDGNVATQVLSDPPGVDEAFARAHLIVEDTFHAGRQYQAYLEPRCVVAEHVDGRYTVHISHQFPYNVRDRMAGVLGVVPEHVRVVGHHIGGGFGAKLDLGLEAHAALLARAAGRPVRLSLSRPEDLLTCPSRENGVVRVRTAVAADGALLAREVDTLLDAGAYAGDAPLLASLPFLLAGAVYRIGPTRVRTRAVYTNTTPTGAFRGVSGTYLVFAFERHLDHIARRLGLDRRELRLRNLVGDGDRLLSGQQLHDASILGEAFAALEKVAPWASLGRGPNRGVGIAAAVWLTNPMPGSAVVRLEDDGIVALVTAATDNGSGAVTMGVTQIVAEELGVRPEQVRVTMPDTDVAPYDAGSQGSRTTHVAGRAARMAAATVREQIIQRAAQLLEAAPADLEIVEGMVGVHGSPEPRLPLRDIAAMATAEGRTLSATAEYKTPAPPYDPGCASGLLIPVFPTPTYHVHIAEVEVDPVTGNVRVLRYLVAQEVGRAINPVGVLGQIQGGVTQGIGYALYEGLSIGVDGRYRQRCLEAYRLPISTDIPTVEVVLLEHPDPAGPFGAKGVGEPPIVPVAAAIGNAIADATGGAMDTIPFTLESVLDALQVRDGA